MCNGMEVRQMSFNVGQTLNVIGIPKQDALTFSVNIGLDKENLAVHLNPRFNWEGRKNLVVCNSFQDGQWSDELSQDCFPFRSGEEFKIAIQFTETGFVMNLCDDSTINFPNRLGAKKYPFFSFTDDVRIISIEVK